ncbi:type II secretion system F family protein [Lichenifustis flavocetrariae]|uniref:Type II secretion system F family protein n=1 Tax=Lichenifustis flavocetrariae TaxID=2949735 RepID=A0AA41Z2U4_9HYPH|nr:type II secretion system F family protein [Lichenifustis flavocetrariae]MCW6511947.1 type II secretion system F family protein [Lichenifustis flavocetrariae]
MPGIADQLFLITGLIFVCVTIITLVAIRTVEQRARRRRRFSTASIVGARADVDLVERERSWTGIDPGRLGLDAAAQRELRVTLMRAGFFSTSAMPAYAVIRIAFLIALPLIGLFVALFTAASWGVTERVALVGILLAVAYYLPPAYLSRRQRHLENRYRLVFPDFLDMLVVCVNAGLSLEAALDRAGRELDEEAAAFYANLELMAGEMRAGKSTGDALKALADRLGLPEARSFVALLQQTIELGTDVAQALTVFSDEMRDKRLSNAEEKAAALPPKLTLPLGLFIFPVVLIAVLAPAVLKVMATLPH